MELKILGKRVKQIEGNIYLSKVKSKRCGAYWRWLEESMNHRGAIHAVAKVTFSSFLFMLCLLSNSGGKRAPLPENSSKTLGMSSCWNNFGKVPIHELIFVVRQMEKAYQ